MKQFHYPLTVLACVLLVSIAAQFANASSHSQTAQQKMESHSSVIGKHN